MDIKFRKPGSPRLDSPKNLPGFRGSSELPEHSLAEEGLTDKPQPYIARKNMDATVPTGPLSDADFESAFSDIEEADNTAAATTENIPGSTPTVPKPAAIKKPRTPPTTPPVMSDPALIKSVSLSLSFMNKV